MTPFINVIHAFVEHFGFQFKFSDGFLDFHMLSMAPYNL
jgi:hypothetical protein